MSAPAVRPGMQAKLSGHLIAFDERAECADSQQRAGDENGLGTDGLHNQQTASVRMEEGNCTRY